MDPDRIRSAVAGDALALSELLSVAVPIVQARAVRALLRRESPSDVADLTQAVLVELVTADGKALEAWDPARGLSFASFVGLLAQRRVSAILGARGDHAQTGLVANDVGPTPFVNTSSREILVRLLERLQAQLSARGMELFERLFVAQQTIEEICAHMDLSTSAVHQWRRRLGHAAEATLREINAPSHRPVAVSGIKLRRGP